MPGFVVECEASFQRSESKELTRGTKCKDLFGPQVLPSRRAGTAAAPRSELEAALEPGVAPIASGAVLRRFSDGLRRRQHR